MTSSGNNIYALVLLIGMISISCSAGKNTNTRKNLDKDYSTLNSLADVLRRQPGVIVSGYGDRIDVQIRGVNSIELDTRPLYVVNDIPMGRDYTTVNRTVSPIQIERIQVLKSYNELSHYGTLGRNGVIKIYLKGSGN